MERIGGSGLKEILGTFLHDGYLSVGLLCFIIQFIGTDSKFLLQQSKVWLTITLSTRFIISLAHFIAYNIAERN